MRAIVVMMVAAALTRAAAGQGIEVGYYTSAAACEADEPDTATTFTCTMVSANEACCDMDGIFAMNDLRVTCNDGIVTARVTLQSDGTCTGEQDPDEVDAYGDSQYTPYQGDGECFVWPKREANTLNPRISVQCPAPAAPIDPPTPAPAPAPTPAPTPAPLPEKEIRLFSHDNGDCSDEGLPFSHFEEGEGLKKVVFQNGACLDPPSGDISEDRRVTCNADGTVTVRVYLSYDGTCDPELDKDSSTYTYAPYDGDGTCFEWPLKNSYVGGNGEEGFSVQCSAPSSDDDDSKLSAGAIAGIAAGCAVVVAGLGVWIASRNGYSPVSTSLM